MMLVKRLDDLLDRMTMYRVVLYALMGMISVAVVWAIFGWLQFSPLAIAGSAAVLVVMCWATNKLFAAIFAAPYNPESSLITALILALIFTPAVSAADFVGLGYAAMVAIASKYILAIGKKHLVNPAAMAAVVTAVLFNNSASWWVGTAPMAAVVAVLGWMTLRKIRREKVVGAFVVTVLILSLTSLARSWQLIVLHSPLLFFATIMLTEPLTMPTMAGYQILFAMLVGVMYVPQFHIGSVYFTPEMALVVGNVFAYAVSSKQKLLLRLKDKIIYSPTTMDLVFIPNVKPQYVPGQYMEWTLAHERSDSRGIRRYFTLASSPTEPELRLGVRLSEKGSSFKQALSNLDDKQQIVANQLAGEFVLPKDRQTKLVLVAGGIGITPFRSMLKYLTDIKQYRDIVLVYSNRTADEIVYRDVFEEAEKTIGLRAVYHLTGETGRLNAQKIVTEIPDYKDRVFYISGPHQFVEAIKENLKELGLGKDRIKTDFFPGLA